MENVNYVFRRNLLIPTAEKTADAVVAALPATTSEDAKDAAWNRAFADEMKQLSKELENSLD